MAEQLQLASEGRAGESNSFVYHFSFLYEQLKKIEDTKSPEYVQLSEVIRNYIVEFWGEKVKKMPQQLGSLGLDENGTEQLALCMDINGNYETTICKWGIEMNCRGERVPKLEILTSPHPQGFHEGHTPYTYNVTLSQNILDIQRTNWPPTYPSHSIENMSISF